MGLKVLGIDLLSEEGFKLLSEQLRQHMLHGTDGKNLNEPLPEDTYFGVVSGNVRFMTCPKNHVHIDFLSPSGELETRFMLFPNGRWSVTLEKPNEDEVFQEPPSVN